jgi:threonine dehydrogenase-like Zn-dependent dehydrogenase
MGWQNPNSRNQQHLPGLWQKTLCSACKKGVSSHCQKRIVIGIINHDGAFADEAKVATGTLHEIPSNVDPLIATLRIHQKREFEFFHQFR